MSNSPHCYTHFVSSHAKCKQEDGLLHYLRYLIYSHELWKQEDGLLHYLTYLMYTWSNTYKFSLYEDIEGRNELVKIKPFGEIEQLSWLSYRCRTDREYRLKDQRARAAQKPEFVEKRSYTSHQGCDSSLLGSWSVCLGLGFVQIRAAKLFPFCTLMESLMDYHYGRCESSLKTSLLEILLLFSFLVVKHIFLFFNSKLCN